MLNISYHPTVLNYGGNNSGDDNSGEDNFGEDPPHNNQNGFRCIFCNLVFITLLALMAHFASVHFVENPAISSLYLSNHVNLQREMILSPLHPNFPRLMVTQETRISVNNMVRVFRAPPEQPMAMPQPRANLIPYATQSMVATSQPFQGPGPSQSMLCASNNVAERAQLFAPPIHHREMEVSPIDETQPYISLLDIPINNNELFNRSIINGDNLDLELRL